MVTSGAANFAPEFFLTTLFETGGVGQQHFRHSQRKMQREEAHALFSTFQYRADLGRAWQAQCPSAGLALLSMEAF